MHQTWCRSKAPSGCVVIRWFAALAALAAISAQASTTQTIGSGPAKVEISAGQYGTLIIIYTNRIVSSDYIENWTLDLDGVTVSGTIDAQDGDHPDDLIVTPPAGWMCDPCQTRVEEGESGAVELFPMVGV
jgi:hypothetical protein